MLVETLIAAALLLVGMAGILSLVDTASSTTRVTQTREAGTALQREIIEAARSIPYEQMTPNTMVGLVSSRPGLGDSQLGGLGWTVNRRGSVFTVSVGVCTVDDPRDGFGPHEAGVFCRRATGASTAECSSWLSVTGTVIGGGVGAGVGVTAGECGIDADLDGSVDGLAELTATLCVLGSCGSPPDPAPADYKRVVSLVRWPGGWNLQTTTVNSPGSAAAPAVVDALRRARRAHLRHRPWRSPPRSPRARHRLLPRRRPTGRDGLGRRARHVGGDVEPRPRQLGQRQPADPGRDPRRRRAWSPRRRSTQYGQFGATRSAGVVINRRRPFAPARVGAGRNGTAVEIDWSPAKELDVEGHRVYRSIGGAGADRGLPPGAGHDAAATRTRRPPPC